MRRLERSSAGPLSASAGRARSPRADPVWAAVLRRRSPPVGSRTAALRRSAPSVRRAARLTSTPAPSPGGAAPAAAAPGPPPPPMEVVPILHNNLPAYQVVSVPTRRRRRARRRTAAVDSADPRGRSHLSNKTAEDRVLEYGSELFRSSGELLLCQFCDKPVDPRRRSSIEYHLKSFSHQRKVRSVTAGSPLSSEGGTADGPAPTADQQDGGPLAADAGGCCASRQDRTGLDWTQLGIALQDGTGCYQMTGHDRRGQRWVRTTGHYSSQTVAVRHETTRSNAGTS